MANNIFTNWDSTAFAQDVIRAFVEAGKIDDSWMLTTYGNDTNLNYGRLAAHEASNAADGGDLADTTVMEDAATSLTPDAPLKDWAYIPESAIFTHVPQANILSSYSDMIGQNVRFGMEARLTNLLIKNAPTQVSFTYSGAAGTDIATALVSVSSNFDINNIPAESRNGLLYGTHFNLMWNVAGARSSDYISGADNSRSFQSINFLGMNIRSAAMKFNVDTTTTQYTTTTPWAVKYRNNNTSTGSAAGKALGVFFTRTALGVNIYKPLTVSVDYVPKQESYLVKGKMIMGSTLPRASAGSSQVLIGV